MAAFPAYAKLNFADFTRRPQPAVDRTDMENGPPKQFKRLSRVMMECPAIYSLDSKADYDAFMVFFNTTIARGALWFDWTDPYDNTVKTARIKGGVIEPKPFNKTLTMWTVKMVIEFWSA